jgi:lambda repressor-like predicted transcriptional regulator
LQTAQCAGLRGGDPRAPRCHPRERFWGVTQRAGSHPKKVHQSEPLANLTEAVKSLFRLAESGELALLLGRELRDARPSHRSVKTLSADEIDQLVKDYRTARSIYVLAERYGVHRNTVAAHLKARGIALGKSSLSSKEVERVRQLNENGLPLNAIGRAIGRDPKTVKNALQ